MIRVLNDNLGRAIHLMLYDRVYQFCLKYTPEFPAEGVVNHWLTRLYNSDPLLHIMISLASDGSGITEHAVVDVQESNGLRVIHCFQLERDKPDIQAMNEFMEFLDKLKVETGASCISFSVIKNSNAYQKRYGYRIARTVLIKSDGISEA